MTDSTRDVSDDGVVLGLPGDALAVAEPLSDELVRTVAEAAYAMRRPDAELADLVFDSALDTRGSRGDDSFRNLVRRCDDIELEIELGDQTDDMYGLVQPAGATCAVETADGTTAVGVDTGDRFDITTTARRLRFVATTADGRHIATPWIFH